ncbi:MAG: dephospho-CoA kinase [Bacteroidetes bacterium HGW-Bacteroidetes-15]|nr:MAG: dephospho-CoA kinase [Bacteroidetes bacterium HGW-Bacteroidetes-15]
MLKVGITGGIGSGKSLVCKIISSLGYPVYHADAEAKKLTKSHPQIISAMKKLFGEDIYIDGELNRKRVGELVFNDSPLLQKLNGIIHPVVAQDFCNWVSNNSQSRLVFKEAAILFESGAYKQVDTIVAVWAPKDLRISRVCKRDGVSFEEVLKRINNQMEDEELISRSNYVIRNYQDELLTPQVVSLIDTLLEI